MSSYLLKFKVNTAVDEAFIERPTFEAAVEEVFENANELEWALCLDGVTGSVNSKDMTRHIIGAVNSRLLGEDEVNDSHIWSREKIRRHYEVM